MKNLKHWGQNTQDTQDQRKTMIKQSAPTTVGKYNGNTHENLNNKQRPKTLLPTFS